MVQVLDRHCLSQPPPAPPPLVEAMARSVDPATPEQADALEGWAGALAAYAERAWHLCGDS